MHYRNKERFGERTVFKGKEDHKNYILFTNVWNEENNIQKTFEMVFNFTLRPTLWVWINDGSTDNTEYMINKCIDQYGISMPTVIVNLPVKQRGDLSKIGQTYNFAFDTLKLKDMRFDFEFMAVIDVDNIIHKDYFEKVAQGFNVEPHIGVISGKHEGTRLNVPMGGSKAIRWWIVRNIKKFWDPAPDMQLNITAKDWNQGWLILDNGVGIVGGPTSSRNKTYKGAYYAGSLWRYVQGSYNGMIQRVIYRILRRRYGIAFLKGFLENKNYWVCEDKKIVGYYEGYGSRFIDWCKRTRISIHSKTLRGFRI